MRHVLYAEDFEPITILELKPFAESLLEERGIVRLQVIAPLQATLAYDSAPVFMEAYRLVTIRAEPVRRNGRTHLMLFTHDEESALLLKSAFLPGQRGILQEREREAFAKGFMKAVDMIGRMQ